MPPGPAAWKLQTPCHSASARSPAPPASSRLTIKQARMTRPRRSTRITRLHSYHGAVRPCATHRYSTPRNRPRARQPLAGRGRAATGSHVPHRSPDQARAASMPDTTWPVSRHPPGSSRSSGSAPVSMSSLPFRHVISGSLTFAFWPTPDALNGAPSPQRSAPRPLTDAPYGGLQPPPAGRLRRTTNPTTGQPLHLRCSTASRI